MTPTLRPRVDPSSALSTIGKQRAMAPKRKAAAAKDDTPKSTKKAKAEEVKGGLQEGDTFPELGDLQTDVEDKTVNLTEVVKDKGFVLFSYPKANTAGCTSQACGFRDNYEMITAAGFEVFGLSADKPKSQASWKTKQKLPYHLLCDPGFEALAKLGMKKDAKSIHRSHIIVEKGGKILAVDIGITPKESIVKAVEFFKERKPDAKEDDAKEDDAKEDAMAEDKPEEDKAAEEGKPKEADSEADGVAVKAVLKVDEAGQSVVLQIEPVA